MPGLHSGAGPPLLSGLIVPINREFTTFAANQVSAGNQQTERVGLMHGARKFQCSGGGSASDQESRETKAASSPPLL
ncbi:unnamed protein product [Heterotrigona itama]|uniref:Uncharacterized protein n=1 Tax=Heterotrigona itama TaxID=395501 RepID=A0A6V7GXJ7_9HYME|nr:unnamed protein product [Heterotrigona itama]